MFSYTLPQTPLDSRLNIPALSFEGRYGLPNSVREALLHLKLGEAALLIDALLYCGVPEGKKLTFRKAMSKLVENGLMLSKALVRRAFNSGLFHWDTLKTRRAGRPEKIYHMPNIGRLVKQYANGAVSAADPMIASDLQNLRLYRQAMHREFIRRAPGIYSRAFLGQRLGVGKRTTRNYDLRVGIIAIRRLRKDALRFYSNWEDFVRAAKPGVNWLQITYDDGREIDAPLFIEIAQNNMWRKGVKEVHLVTQLCNRYVLATQEQLNKYQSLRLHDDERAFGKESFGVKQGRTQDDPISTTLAVDRKAYRPKSDPIPAWLPPEMAARRISTNPFLPRRKANTNDL